MNLNPSVRLAGSRALTPRLAPLGSIFDIPLGAVNEPGQPGNTNVPYPGAVTAPTSSGITFGSVIGTGITSFEDALFPGFTALTSLFSGTSTPANPTDSTSSASYSSYSQATASGNYGSSASAYTGQPTASSTPTWLWPAVIGGGLLIVITSIRHHGRR